MQSVPSPLERERAQRKEQSHLAVAVKVMRKLLFAGTERERDRRQQLLGKLRPSTIFTRVFFFREPAFVIRDFRWRTVLDAFGRKGQIKEWGPRFKIAMFVEGFFLWEYGENYYQRFAKRFNEREICESG